MILAKTKSGNLVNPFPGFLSLEKKSSNNCVVNPAALRMILDPEGKRIIPKPDLLDDIVRGAPGFDHAIISPTRSIAW